MDITKVKATIRALLNLAGNEAAAAGEIANATRFAARLMERHQLDEADLTEVDDLLLDLERAEFAQVAAHTDGVRMSSWECHTAHVVCELVGGVDFYRDREARRESGIIRLDRRGRPLSRDVVQFYGVAEDAELARQVFCESCLTIAAMARLRFGGVYRGPGLSYCEGFAVALGKHVERDAQQQLAKSTGRDLVVLQNRAALVARKKELAQEWLKDQGIRLGQAKAGGYFDDDADAFQQGLSDGARHQPQAVRRAKLTESR